MSAGKVLFMDVADRCAWVATPDGSQCHRTNISIGQIRGLVKAGMITMRLDQNTTQATFIVSAKGQAEVRKIRRREAELQGNLNTPMEPGAKDERRKQQGRTKMHTSSEAVSAPRSGRDLLRQAVERARKFGSLIHEES